MSILTIAEIAKSPVQYLQRRFVDTVIRTANKGVVYVSGVPTQTHFTLVEWDEEALCFIGDGKHYSLQEMGDIVEAAPLGGFINTPFGMYTLRDKAGHQWQWGSCAARYQFNGRREISTNSIMYYLFQSDGKVYPQQLKTNHPKIALSRTLYWDVESGRVFAGNNREIILEDGEGICSISHIQKLKDKLELA